ncbi:hypothetical protein [Alicyclobacillus ferrooxydans]|uniref:Uncharacterized protein n=1 Tax=Alicyclobacillus ferrooxydans TaxID=471514 RepID=A0A0P9C2Q7_9BACL|nr:hypothetical protein [Alicyclobacillus ferrooxydans]KPV38940.1 hypothetical protein AN477_23135 [Alicyclobacillus ferrooxydans]
MELFHSSNHSSLDNLYFHDAELGDIRVSYKDNQVVVYLHDVRIEQESKSEVELTFSGVTELHVPINEPWGGGYYCVSLTTEQDGKLKTEQFRTKLLLNSGDEINIVATQVQLNSSQKSS